DEPRTRPWGCPVAGRLGGAVELPLATVCAKLAVGHARIGTKATRAGSSSTHGERTPRSRGPFEPRECRLLAFLVGRTADDVEATVELHVDLAAVVACHLDLVVA